MNMIHTLVAIAPKHTEAAIVMDYQGRKRVRHTTLHQSVETLQEQIKSYELQFLKDVGANGKVLRKGTLSLLSDQRRKRSTLPSVEKRTLERQPDRVSAWLQSHPGIILPDSPSTIAELVRCSRDCAKWYLRKRRNWRRMLRQQLSQI